MSKGDKGFSIWPMDYTDSDMTFWTRAHAYAHRTYVSIWPIITTTGVRHYMNWQGKLVQALVHSTS